MPTKTKDSAEQKSQQAIASVRPLNATQARNLEKLVRADFSTLRTEILDFTSKETEAVKEKIKEKYAKKDALTLDWKRKAQELLTQQARDREDLVREAKTKGVTLDFNVYASNRDVSAKSVNYDDELRDEISKINAKRDQALRAHERALNEALRKVFIASITATAQDVLSSIPSAKELLAAQAAPKTEQITS